MESENSHDSLWLGVFEGGPLPVAKDMKLL